MNQVRIEAVPAKDPSFRTKELRIRQHRTLGLQLKTMSSVTASKKNRKFNPRTFLATIGQGRKSLTVVKKERIFTQGDAADAVFYIQKGKVRLTVVSKTGKEATIGI
jgi:CRP-like cAMP-binding protein